MAELALTIQLVTIYAIGTLLLLKMMSTLWSVCHRRVFAYVMSRLLSPTMERLTERFKRETFGDLPDVAEKLKVDDLSILEIGMGSGVNFKFYPKGTTVYPLDPNPHFNRYLEENMKINKHVDVKPFIECYGEDMTAKVADQSVDAVVCTLTLCSVVDTAAVLREVKRALKPGGKFYFIEHVAAAKGTWMSLFQVFVMTPLFKRFCDNCHWDRETWVHIDRAGFANVQHRTMRTSILVVLYGSATK